MQTSASPYIKHEYKHIKGAAIVYRFIIRPADWTAATVLVAGHSLVSPTTPNGCVYEVTSSGITADTEPTWPTVENGAVIDGDVKYKTLADTAYLREGDSVTACAVTASHADVTISQIVYSNNSLRAKAALSADSAISEFNLLFKPTITRANGDTETPIFTLNVKVQA